MCVYVYVYVYVDVYVLICICICIYVYVYVYVYIYRHVIKYSVGVCVCVYVYICMLCMYIYTCLHLPSSTRIYIQSAPLCPALKGPGVSLYWEVACTSDGTWTFGSSTVPKGSKYQYSVCVDNASHDTAARWMSKYILWGAWKEADEMLLAKCFC